MVDEFIVSQIKPWKEYIDQKGLQVVGETKVTLLKTPCNLRECNIGNFLTDAFVNYYATQTESVPGKWTPAAIAILNTGGIRTTLDKGCNKINCELTF